MQPHLLSRDKLILLVVWSFFSFSIMKIFSIFLYASHYIFLWYACVYSILFFVYYVIFKVKFSGLNYLQYTLSKISFVVLVTIFSYIYYKVILLDNDYFIFSFFLAIAISNVLLGSILFLLTLIKRK